MNVDLYCTQCSHIIETICTNLDAYQHSLHKSEHDDVTCNQCSASTHVVIRCYIPRDTVAEQMSMQSQSQEQDDYEGFTLSSAISRRHAG
jgi:hypothetical protein